MSGAVKKMPVFKVQSSQRPITTPIRMGATIAQPSTPIWPRREAKDGSGSSRKRRVRSAASRAASSIFPPRLPPGAIMGRPLG